MLTENWFKSNYFKPLSLQIFQEMSADGWKPKRMNSLNSKQNKSLTHNLKNIFLDSVSDPYIPISWHKPSSDSCDVRA